MCCGGSIMEVKMDTYKVSTLFDVKKINIIEVEKKQPSGKQVLIKVDSCAICTLEQRVYNGVMKRYPFAGGHEAAGIVEAIGNQVKSVKPGDKVAVRLLNSCGECYYCRNGNENQCVVSFIAETHEGIGGPGGLSEYMMIDAENVYKMEPDVNLTYAALSEPLACCVHSVRKANIGLGDDVVVIGVGIMGAFHIQLAKLSGARVIACEVDNARLETAQKLGADIVINSSEMDAVAKIKELTEGRGADVVFCTVALSQIAESAVHMAGKIGKVIFYSSFHPDNPISISPNKIHSTEQIITGSVNPQRKDFLTATRLLSYHLIDVSMLISDIVPFAEIDRAFIEAVEPSSYRIIVKC
ncbi:MAG: Zn-dependent alcohol dehydrogenase [Herbinix sp.]|jgi:L-iditol 2-dehydrogenase|nr:Zn-dependent alcohol dehydrogenase [Herbinix sp.]